MPDKIKITQYYNLTAILFCVFILIISLILGCIHVIGNFGVETDFYGTYSVQAKNILSWQPYTYLHNPPGYPILLAGFSFITGDLFTAGKIISSIAFALLGLISYLIFKNLFNEKAALFSIPLFFITLIPYSFLASTDVVGAMFATIPILILLNRERVNLKSSFITGITCGLAYLVRSDSIFVTIGIAVSLLFVLSMSNWKEKFFNTGILILGVILITSPWFIYNWKMNGSPFATTAYLQVGLYFYDDKEKGNEPEIKKAAEENSTSASMLFINPVHLILKYIKQIHSRIERLTESGAPFPLYFFLGGGFLFFLQDLNRKRLAYLIIWLLGFLIFGLISFNFRHYFSLVPFISFLIVYSLFNEKFFNHTYKVKFIIRGVIILLIIFLLKDSYKKTKDFYDSEPKYLIEAADFLKKHSSGNDIIISRKPHLSYLSGLKCYFIYEESAEKFLEKAKLMNARYIVYSDFESTLWPGLKVLSNPDSLPNGFHLIYQHKPTNTLIYEIK